MNKEELRSKYDHLYRVMAESKNPENMMLFGKAEKHMFHELAEAHPEAAEAWLAMLMPVEWNNYLSEAEAKEIGEHMENQDGTMGYHWPCAVLFPAVESLGGVIEEKPFYNKYALAAVMNMIYSDHADSIAMDMGGKKASDISNEKMAMSCYRKAIEKLKDPDRPRFVRWYFHM